MAPTTAPTRTTRSGRRRLGIALAAACPTLLAGGCYGHGAYAYHHGYGSHCGSYAAHGSGNLLLPLALFYVLFWAASSC